MRVDMAGVHAAFGQDIDPERAAFQLFALQIKAQILDEGRDMFVQRLFQIGKNREAPGQIVQAGIAGIAGIAVVFAPLLTGFVIFGNRLTGRFQFSVINLLLAQIIHRGAVQAGDEKRCDLGHIQLLLVNKKPPPVTAGAFSDPNDGPRISGKFAMPRWFCPIAKPYQSSRTTTRVVTGSFIAPKRRASRAITSDTPSISNMMRPGFTLAAQ